MLGRGVDRWQKPRDRRRDAELLFAHQPLTVRVIGYNIEDGRQALDRVRNALLWAGHLLGERRAADRRRQSPSEHAIA